MGNGRWERCEVKLGFVILMVNLFHENQYK